MRYEFQDIPLKREDNGKELYFNKCDCPASFADKNVLCIHGLTYTNHVFDINYKDYSVVRYLAKNGYTVWRLDIGGYGKSEQYEDGFEVDTLNASKDITAALRKICELQGVPNVDVIGWSWGSMTTSKVAANNPELIRKLVWIGPCFGGTLPSVDVTAPFTELTYSYVTRVFQHMPGSDIDVDYDTVEKEVCGIWCDQVFKVDGSHGRPNGGNREIMRAGQDWLIDVPSVKVPTAIMTGDIDMYVDQERCKIALSQLPEGSELHVYHGAGHALYCETDYYVSFREKTLAFFSK